MSKCFLFVLFLLSFASFITSQNISEVPIELPICPSAKTEDPLQTLVVGGEPADRYEFPWLVNLIVNKTTGREICGGSLIDWVCYLFVH